MKERKRRRLLKLNITYCQARSFHNLFKSGFQRHVHRAPSGLGRVHHVPEECTLWVLTHSVHVSSFLIDATTVVFAAHTHTTWLQRRLKLHTSCNLGTSYCQLV